MHFKRLLLFFTGMLFILLIASCAVTHPNEQLIVGDWKPVKAEKYIPPPKESKTKQSQADTAKMARKSQKPKKARLAGDTEFENQLQRMMQTEMRSPISVNANNTVVKFYPGKIIKGTWKLKKKGTRIVAKEKEANKKMTLDILEISENSISVVERFPFGDIKIDYARKK
jgi:hypothetical protein